MPNNLWIRRRIRANRFKKDKNFIVLAESNDKLFGGNPSKEYHVSLEMAKSLGMIEKGDGGDEAMWYFVDCGKSHHVIITSHIILDWDDDKTDVTDAN